MAENKDSKPESIKIEINEHIKLDFEKNIPNPNNRDDSTFEKGSAEAYQPFEDVASPAPPQDSGVPD